MVLSSRTLLAAGALVVVVVGGALVNGATDGTPAPASAPPAAGQQVPDGLPTVRPQDLPAEARTTLRLIDRGGPFPYSRDGVVFANREGLLPRQRSGCYHEYTVRTPGESDRGARRVITSCAGPRYWTPNHYESFDRIVTGS